MFVDEPTKVAEVETRPKKHCPRGLLTKRDKDEILGIFTKLRPWGVFIAGACVHPPNNDQVWKPLKDGGNVFVPMEKVDTIQFLSDSYPSPSSQSQDIDAQDDDDEE